MVYLLIDLMYVVLVDYMSGTYMYYNYLLYIFVALVLVSCLSLVRCTRRKYPSIKGSVLVASLASELSGHRQDKLKPRTSFELAFIREFHANFSLWLSFRWTTLA